MPTDLNPGEAILSSSLTYPPHNRSLLPQRNLIASFKKFGAAVQKRLQNRTPLLDAVLNDLEDRVQELRRERDSIATHAPALRSALLKAYQPLAESSCIKIAQRLRDIVDAEGTAVSQAVFVGRLAHALCGPTSQLMDNVGVEGDGRNSKLLRSRVRIQPKSVVR